MTRKIIRFIIAWSCSSLMICLAHAAGDPVAGKDKTQLCAGCHGVDGNSSVSQWPSLAGQNQRYLIKQMTDYRAGETSGRYDETMTALMQDLTPEDMADIAAYYASQLRKVGEVDAALLERGQQLYRGGDLERHISACSACHGPKGFGNAYAGFPALSGQQPEYVITQLLAYQTGQRANDMNHIMRDIAKRMEMDDIHAVASYVHGLY